MFFTESTSYESGFPLADKGIRQKYCLRVLIKKRKRINKDYYGIFMNERVFIYLHTLL